MKRSIGVRTQPGSFTSGTAGRSTRSKAQWPRYSAPSAIQRERIATSAAVIGLLIRGGGVTTSGSVLVIRDMSALFAESPGTTAVALAATIADRHVNMPAALRMGEDA